MNVFFGISSSKNLMNLKEGDKSFWCIYSGYRAQIEDVLLMYFTGVGIRQVYQLITVAKVAERVECQTRGMKTVDTQLAVNLTRAVTVAQLKAHPVAKGIGPVRRNFQETVFRIRPEEWPTLLQLMVDNNPQLETLLCSFET
mgnify:FL=1